MPRIRPLRKEEAPQETQGYFEADERNFGSALNSTSIYAYCPPVLEAARRMGPAIEKSGRLPRQLRCLLNVKAASLTGCPF